jgi:alkanesulfonate monooxygenase SsuD/methylene tetrahydromethanopterin reductase-like flavin-dependent oxidoreductase (luciferase family)
MGTANFADNLSLLIAAAAKTERIRLGSAIASYARPPLLMAQQAIVVHEIAPGRLRLGIGTGNHIVAQRLYGQVTPSPLAYLKEYVEVIRNALWEGSTEYRGKIFNIADTKTWFVTPRKAQIPLLISALGLKAFRLAGEVADGVLPWMCPAPYLLNAARAELRAGAESRQRPIPPMVAHIMVAMHEDEATVLASARQWVQRYTQLAWYARMFAQAGFAGAVKGDEAELDALARTLVISGDEETVRKRIYELLESGLDELMLQPLTITDEAGERERLLRVVGTL